MSNLTQYGPGDSETWSAPVRAMLKEEERLDRLHAEAENKAMERADFLIHRDPLPWKEDLYLDAVQSLFDSANEIQLAMWAKRLCQHDLDFKDALQEELEAVIYGDLTREDGDGAHG